MLTMIVGEIRRLHKRAFFLRLFWVNERYRDIVPVSLRVSFFVITRCRQSTISALILATTGFGMIIENTVRKSGRFRGRVWS
jgi:hypothetical protein